MNSQQMKKLSQKHQPNSHAFKKAWIAFITGGALACLGQLCVSFLTLYKSQDDATTIVLLGVIFLSSGFTGLGFYDRMAQKLGAGLFVPISGFANALTSSALECKSEGLIYGIGSNMFKLAGSVITYGIVSGLLFSSIRYIGYLL